MKETARRDARFTAPGRSAAIGWRGSTPICWGSRSSSPRSAAASRRWPRRSSAARNPPGPARKRRGAQQRRGRKARENGVGWPK